MKTLEFGDMIFYAIVSLILILLFWLRFLEPSIGLWGAWLVWAAWACFLVRSYLKARRARL
ncbi:MULTISPECIES: hypothetical protein [unclassified Mesorhizobium]|uniref:hypothetical protein n=1 Tax=unclassified Mesorhizobium TaxID=325217 RepID=UPI0009590532|nr:MULTISPECIES: hypothetical protein [unclassified Mesorhizobium]MBN9259040.1 hypothetical protein [Mesorhizobium sp.]MBN9271119.1 hypothetical protein [Mesorhizobium sp.]OJX71680.1 MAG: hypothetical protein BGO93_09795 [Mesorhizobium sp. 65-26]